MKPAIKEPVWGEEMYRRMVVLRMQRQHLCVPADREAYDRLYRDCQPGQNEYWHGFGQPPILEGRADFDDREYNRVRLARHQLYKGRFQGGNLGWVCEEDMELFACLCAKPLTGMTLHQEMILRVISQQGPLNIQQLKEETGLLVKEITPALHRLQEAFILYEDQYDGEWDRAWYRLEEMFPELSLTRYTKLEAAKIILLRFAHRMVWFTQEMAKSFYKLSVRELKAALDALAHEGLLEVVAGGYIAPADRVLLQAGKDEGFTGTAAGVIVMHRNDMLVKAQEHAWKEAYKPYICAAKARFAEASDFDVLYLLIMDGEIHGAVLGKFKYGPYIVEDIVVDEGYAQRRDAILAAVQRKTPESRVYRFMGEQV